MPSFPNIDDPSVAALLEYLHAPAPAANPTGVAEMTSAPALGAAPPPPDDELGAAVYSGHCAICHGDHMEGDPGAIPMLVALGNRYNAGQVSDLIHKGKNAMPPAPGLEGPELQALLHYLGVAETTKPVGSPVESSTGKYVFTGYRKFLDPDGYPAIQPPWGTLSAIDLRTGKYLWKIPLGEYPELVKQGIRNTGTELYGGPIVTAGGVVFIGATVYDRKFHAFDSRTGHLLWETELPFAGIATPSTYMADGRQYVVIAASGGRDPKSPEGGAYIAFALPRQE